MVSSEASGSIVSTDLSTDMSQVPLYEIPLYEKEVKGTSAYVVGYYVYLFAQLCLVISWRNMMGAVQVMLCH